MAIKILFTSDIHLGLKKDDFIDNRKQYLSTFRKISLMATRYDILLIAGHLIYETTTNISLIDIIKEEFKKITEKGTEIFYTATHEELSNQILIEGIEKIHGVTIFPNTKKSNYIKSKKGDLFVYGPSSKINIVETMSCTNRERGFHLGLFHADFNPKQLSTGSENSINEDDIKRLNLNFYALGKNHNFKIFRSKNKIIGAHAGSPEPCCFEESGDRYVISMIIENDKISQIRRIPVNHTDVINCKIDCTSINDEQDLLLKIKEMQSSRSILNIELCGIKNFNINQNFPSEFKGSFKGLRVIDKTIPSLNLQITKFKDSKSLKGEFFRSIEKKIKNDDFPKEIEKNTIAEILNREESSRNEEVLVCTF